MGEILLMAFLVGQSPGGPVKFRAYDTPNDEGRSITLEWSGDPGNIQSVKIFRSESPAGPFTPVKILLGNVHSYKDNSVEDYRDYYYRIILVTTDNRIFSSDVIGPVASKPSWFNTEKLPLFVLLVFYILVLLYYLISARKGKEIGLRPLPGLKAIDEAVGRAAEMGKPILFTTGLLDLNNLSTIAALNILAHVARKAAQYQTRIIVPNYNPVVYSVADAIVKEAFIAEGRPDLYNKDDIFYISSRQFGYAAGVTGIMLREKTAAHFFMGYYFAEALLLTEVGASTGAIQVAGTDAVTQLPFFIVTCDYTLIGEEFYAASAYLSKDKLLSATIKGQDIMKGVIIAFLLIFFIVALVSEELAMKVAQLL